MTDKTELQDNNDGSEEPQNDDVRQDGFDGQDIFEQRFHELMDEFGDKCEKHGVQLAIVMAMYPTPNGLDEEESEKFERPMVYFKGQLLESMSLAAEVLRTFKTGVAQSLDTDPYAGSR